MHFSAIRVVVYTLQSSERLRALILMSSSHLIQDITHMPISGLVAWEGSSKRNPTWQAFPQSIEGTSERRYHVKADHPLPAERDTDEPTPAITNDYMAQFSRLRIPPAMKPPSTAST